MILYVLLGGAATGLVLGLMGSGGAIVTVPALLYLMHVPPKSAIAMSLGVVAVTALLAAVQAWSRKEVNLRVTVIFGAVGALGSLVGSRIGLGLPETVQLALFALVMYAAAWRMMRGAPVHRSAGAMAVADCEQGDCSNFPYLHVARHGLAVGVIAGMVGVGGGFLIVPALVMLSGLSMRRAVGTSLSIVATQSAAGFLGYARVVPINYPLLAGLAGVAVATSFLGARISRRLHAVHLRRIFGIFLVVVATFILFKNLA